MTGAMSKTSSPRHKHAAVIEAAWRKAVASIIETGQRLIDAKDQLEHGQFIEMVRDDLPFSIRTAQCLMAIATHEVVSKAQFTASLPAAWFTLYQLTRLPPDVLLHYMQDGTVHPELKQQKAIDLVNRHCIPKVGKELKVLPAAANPKGRRGLPGIPRRFCFDRWTGEELTPEAAWQKLLGYRIWNAKYLAQANWHEQWPLWKTYAVTPSLIKDAEQVLAAWGELVAALKWQAQEQTRVRAQREETNDGLEMETCG